jgi:hypothetical protein
MTTRNKYFRNTAIAGLAIAGGLVAFSAQAKNFSQNNVSFRASPAMVRNTCEKLGMAYKALAKKYYTCDGAEFVCRAGGCKGRTNEIAAPNLSSIDNPAAGEGGEGGGGGQ